jgi:hypothetical protein
LAAVWLLPVACSSPFDQKAPSPAFSESAVLESAPESGEGPTVELSGRVVDARGLPVVGVTISAGSDSTTSDEDGAFSLSPSGDPVVLTVAADGMLPLSRTLHAGRGGVVVPVYGAPVAEAVEVANGGTVEDGEGYLYVPADALGTSGLAAVTFQAFSLDHGGAGGIPVGDSPADDRWVALQAAALVRLEGPAGALTASSSLTASLDAAGVSVDSDLVTVYRADEGGSWTEVGTATVGTTSVSFAVDQSGVYGVGEQHDYGCLAGQAVDSGGTAIAGATVHAVWRAAATATWQWLDSDETASDGSFCVDAPAGLAVTLLAEWDAGDGSAPWFGTTVGTSASGGDVDTCEACTDAGQLLMEPAGCVDGNVYGADGSVMADTPFVWGEFDVARTDAEGSLTFYARAGAAHTLLGPGGYASEDTFEPESGHTVDAGNCVRLGNLQLPTSCLPVQVVDGEGAGLAGVRVEAGDVQAATDQDGAACLDAEAGRQDVVASYAVGAQQMTATTSVTLDAAATSCWSGTCPDAASVTLDGPGCLQGYIYDADGAPLSGVTVWSGTFDSTTSDSDGAFSLTTAGAGLAAAWADGYAVQYAADGGPDACTSVTLYPDAGTPPDAWYILDTAVIEVSGGDEEAILSGEGSFLGDATAFDVDEDAGLAVYIHQGKLAYRSELDGDDYGVFVSSYWSSARISPDGSRVALLGYGSANATVEVVDTDGENAVVLSNSAATNAPLGLAWSPDGNLVASTRKDEDIEVTASDGTSSPVTVAPAPCQWPVFIADDTIAVECSGGAYTTPADTSSLKTWAGEDGIDEAIRAYSDASGRLAWTLDNELHAAEIDGSGDALLLVAGFGAEFGSVAFSEDGGWVLAIVADPVAGTDVWAIRDAAPYSAVQLTFTPDDAEDLADWAE